MKEIEIFAENSKIKEKAKTLGLKALEELPKAIKINNKKDEDLAVSTAINQGRVYIQCDDWKIIPLENLIAKCKNKGKIVAVVKSSDEAKLALETMEIGADGILLVNSNEKEIEKTAKLLEVKSQIISLEEATITKINQLGLGERACIDTCLRMISGEGMLVGSSSQGMLLIQAEVEKNELASPRPFRVNAGAISLYTLIEGNKTKYLEEIITGDNVLVIDREGIMKAAIVGRVKIEVRPMILIEAQRKDGKKAVAILQNAETVRLVTKDSSKSVTEIKPGDSVLAHFEDGGRHFGTLLKEETIIEK